jgi:hypothetical protein
MLQAGGRVLYDYNSVLLEVGSRDVFEKAVQRGRKAVDATRESAQPQAWRCFVMHCTAYPTNVVPCCSEEFLFFCNVTAGEVGQ